MKFLIKTILIAGIAYFIADFTPWFAVVGVAFFVALLIRSSGIGAFMSGFIGIGLLWIIQSWMIDTENASLLSTKIAQLFSLPAGWYMIIISGVVGGLVAGFGALSGHTLRNLIQAPKKKSAYY
jgi:hypothetical protein